MSIIINLDKAKTIAHDKRRAARTQEFAPLDEIISKQIPGKDYSDIEAQRQSIRDKYAQMQNAIDASSSPEELKDILGLN